MRHLLSLRTVVSVLLIIALAALASLTNAQPPDADGDGVADAQDSCPTLYADPNIEVRTPGCPGAGFQAVTCGDAVVHTVARGDTLFRIAQFYGTSVDVIVSTNALANANRITPGQQLRIPCPPGTPAAPTAPPAVIDEPFIPPVRYLDATNAARIGEVFVRSVSALPTEFASFYTAGDEVAAFLSANGAVSFYSLFDPTTMPGSFGGESPSVYAYAASPNGTQAFAALDSATGSTVITIRSASSGQDVGVRMPDDLGAALTDIALSDSLLATTAGALTGVNPGALQGVALWALNGSIGTQTAFLPNDAPVYALAFSPDGSRLAVANINGLLQVWDVTSPQPTAVIVLDGSPDSVSLTSGGGSLRFSPDGQQLAVGGRNGGLWLWDVNGGELLGLTQVSAGLDTFSLAFSADGGLLAVAGGAEGGSDEQDTSIYLFDVARMSEPDAGFLVGLEGHTGRVTGLAFSGDNTLLVSVSSDGTLRLWGVR